MDGPRYHWPMQDKPRMRGPVSGRLRIALAAILALMLSALGAVAIYLIHSTMPQGGQSSAPAAVSAREPSGRPATAQDRTAASPRQTGGETSVPDLSQTPGEAAPKTAQGGAGAPEDGGTHAAEDGGTPTVGGGGARVQSRTKAEDARPAALPAGRQPSAAADTARSPRPPAAPAPPGKTARPASLAQAQASDCSQEGLISGFICKERVRLRFCRDRWNVHPDCQVEPERTQGL